MAYSILNCVYCNGQPRYSESSFVYEIRVERYARAGQATDGNIVRLVRFAWWLTKPTETHSEYVILIAFTQDQWLHERATVSLYTHCLSFYVLPVILFTFHLPRNKICFLLFYLYEYLVCGDVPCTAYLVVLFYFVVLTLVC